MKLTRTGTYRPSAVFDDIDHRGDRLMTLLVLGHAAFAIAIAPAYSTWLVTLIVTPLAAGMFLMSRWLAPRTLVTASIAGVALQTFCALHIYQYHGLAEQHFWFFTSTTAMIVYQNPAAIWPGVALIIAQHILFATLHNSGVQLYFFEDAYVGWAKLGFHFGIAGVQASVASTIAQGLRSRTLREAQLREEIDHARERAEAGQRARGMFLASMSHEIRTPMNGIEGMADVLLQSDLGPEERECVRTIQTSSRALLHVVGDILDFSRVESGRLELESIPFDPIDLGVQVGRLLRTRATENGVSLDVDWGPGVARSLVGDPARVRQILVNLVGNAIKFAPNGRVALRIGTSGAIDAKDHALVLEVEDDGIGMTQEAVDRAFAPFEQADASTTRRFGGTGLGLAITQRLVQRMGGAIDVESEPEVGTVFRVCIPLAADPDAVPWRSSGANALRGLPIAFLGDDPVVELARRELADAGVDMAADPASADVVIGSIGPSGAPDELARRGRRGVALLGTGESPDVPGDMTVLPRPFTPEALRDAALEAAGADGAPEGPREEDPRPSEQLGGLRVLVAEDNAVNRRVVERMLGVLGCEVTFAEDGQRAVEALEASLPDVVLMDCQMPVLSGYEATERWRAIERARGAERVPIIALTASALEGERGRCIEAGMDECIIKPASLDMLGATLAAHARPRIR